jgi:hypothetical protein
LAMITRIAIAENVYDREDPNVAVIVNNLGAILKDVGDLAGAKEHYGRVLNRNRRGEEHPNTKLVQENLESLRR